MDEREVVDVEVHGEVREEVREEVEQLADGRTIRYFSWVDDG